MTPLCDNDAEKCSTRSGFANLSDSTYIHSSRDHSEGAEVNSIFGNVLP